MSEAKVYGSKKKKSKNWSVCGEREICILVLYSEALLCSFAIQNWLTAKQINILRGFV